MRENFRHQLARECAQQGGSMTDLIVLFHELCEEKTEEELCDGDCEFCGNACCVKRKIPPK